MYLVDTNIIIYSTIPANFYLWKFIKSEAVYCSKVSKIEALGYKEITPKDVGRFNEIFSVVSLLDISDDVIEKAILLRQSKKFSLGDSIIAATAINNKLTLVTNNISDFKNLSEIKLLNPMQQ